MMQQEFIKDNPVSQIEFQVSQIIGRLEEAVIKKNTSSTEQSVDENVINNNLTIGTTPSTPLKHSESVLQQLEELFLHHPEDADIITMPELCETSLLSIVSHAVGALAGSMERHHITHLNSKITSETTHWITDLFRCPNFKVCYHDDQLEGVVRLVRCLLHMKVSHYPEHGFEALKKKLPIIYTSVSAPVGIVHHICRQLGLPISCIKPIPTNSLLGCQRMDMSALEKEIEADKANNNNLPLIVLADAGTPIAGHVDNITRLQEICKNNDVWLHMRGHSLAALTIPHNNIELNKFCDSMTLPLGIWLGIPGLPVATVYDQEMLISASTGLMDHPGRKLIALPLWTTLQSLGKEEIKKRFKNAFDWCQQLWNRLKKFTNIRLLSQTPGGEGGVISIDELAAKPLNANVLFELTACAVVFQYVPENKEGHVSSYYDKLNSWLGQILLRDCPHVNINLCEIENGEVLLRYCPLESSPSIHDPPDFDPFISCLEQQLDILNATVEHKIEFNRLAENSNCLKLVEVDGWAGLGGVRYIPTTFRNSSSLTDHAKQQLNILNTNLVERLRATDQAFSTGEGADGMICVRFGMVTGDTDVTELLNLVESAGLEEEESEEILDSMAEVVKKGIEAATTELQRESDEAMWQEGLLRQVPVVGSIVNWWSPNNNKQSIGIKGRTLDLTAGIVASTENIYRFHMQTSANQPLEQTSVGHSRSSSTASSTQPVQQFTSVINKT